MQVSLRRKKNKKIAAQISYQGRLPKTAQICAACTANWPKLPKNELQKNEQYVMRINIIDIYGLSMKINICPEIYWK